MPNFLTPVTDAHFDVIDSTNTQLIHAVTSGMLLHHTHHLYTANHQTAGRGQHGRTWVSDVGNVFLSLYVPMGSRQFELNVLSGLLSLAVGHGLVNLPTIKTINEIRLHHHLPLIGVKWANDVGFYDDDSFVFKKLAGILIEPVFKKLEQPMNKSTLVGVVIGVGLNVNHSPIIKDGLYQAVCLNELSDTAITPQALYAPMANQILQAIQVCNRCHDPIYLQSFLDDFNASHLLTDKHVHIFIQNNMVDIFTKGRCIGIGNQGELLLANNDHIRPIFAGMAKIAQHK